MVRFALFICAMLAAPVALALPLCSVEGQIEDTEVQSTEQAPLSTEADLAEALAAVEPPAEDALILPCAALENGVWGQVCLDGQGYLVTDSGVVLCQVFHSPFGGDVAVDSTRVEDQLPDGTTAPMGPTQAGVLGQGHDLSGVLATERTFGNGAVSVLDDRLSFVDGPPS